MVLAARSPPRNLEMFSGSVWNIFMGKAHCQDHPFCAIPCLANPDLHVLWARELILTERKNCVPWGGSSAYDLYPGLIRLKSFHDSFSLSHPCALSHGEVWGCQSLASAIDLQRKDLGSERTVPMLLWHRRRPPCKRQKCDQNRHRHNTNQPRFGMLVFSW